MKNSPINYSKLPEPDFLIKDSGREYRIFPKSEIAKQITQQYRGAIMTQFAVSYCNFDSWQHSIDTQYPALTWIEELT